MVHLRLAPVVARESAALVALFGASWIWLPFALPAEGTTTGPELGLMVALAVSALAPLFALPVDHGRVRRWVLAGAALLLVAAAGGALEVPSYSAVRLQRLNRLPSKLAMGIKPIGCLIPMAGEQSRGGYTGGIASRRDEVCYRRSDDDTVAPTRYSSH